jgi:hypothetical protein
MKCCLKLLVRSLTFGKPSSYPCFPASLLYLHDKTVFPYRILQAHHLRQDTHLRHHLYRVPMHDTHLRLQLARVGRTQDTLLRQELPKELHMPDTYQSHTQGQRGRPHKRMLPVLRAL